MDSTPAASATGMKPMAGVPIAPQSTKITAPPLTGIGKSESHKRFPLRQRTAEIMFFWSSLKVPRLQLLELEAKQEALAAQQHNSHRLKGKMFSQRSCKEGQQSRRENWEMVIL